jgi:hypothetical protein
MAITQGKQSMNWKRFLRGLSCGVVAEMLCVGSFASAQATHSAAIVLQQDPTAANFYTGTSTPPASVGNIKIVGGAPGYMNSVSGGTFGTAGGQVGITGQVGSGPVELVALAIHVTDTAGPSHSLSTMSDPALADIVNDLSHSNPPSLGYPITVYPYNSAPPEYTDPLSRLSTGESSLGGQQFDVLLAASPPFSVGYWTLDLSNEVGNLDGITSLSVTDIGAVPEPEASTFLTVGLAGTLLTRRRRGGA